MTKRVVVLTTGCYDLMHVGHLRHLEECRAQGDYLIVGVNGDVYVRRLKGPGRPLVPAAQRAELVAALRCVDEVRIFEEDTPWELIQAVRPDVLAAGCDYSPERIVGGAFVEGYGGRVYVSTAARTVSTTDLIDAVRRLPIAPEPKP